MQKNEVLEEILKEVDKHPEIMSRRDAFKYLTLSPMAASILATSTVASSELRASDAKGKIVIVGGGLAGISTAARLNNALSDADITIIEPDSLSPSYQPGHTLVAGGLWDISEVKYNLEDKIPNGVKLIKGYATAFDPKNNKLTVDGNQEVSYDQLVVATGVVLDYKAIKGLDGVITSTGDFDKAKESGIGSNGLHSMFYQDGASATWDGIQELIAQAKVHKGTKKLQAVFTHPNTAIKCGGAPKKIMYLTHSRLVEAGVRDKVEMTFYPNSGKMFSVPEYNEAIIKQFKERDFKWNFKHNLTAVDVKNKVATFDKQGEKQGEYDDDLEEYDVIKTHENIEVSYDFMHVTPPMKPAEAIGSSPIGSPRGWVPVRKETLQHVKFDNVWSLGDVAAIPLGKTGGSIRKQYKIVVDNILAAMEGKKELPAKFDGYTVCPFVTDIGKVMLAEFNWTMKPAPSFPLDPTQERWIWWLMKLYALKPMTVVGMMKGYA